MTDLADTLWDLEKRFWLEGADFYEGRLASGAVMVLPYPAGLMERDAAVAAVRDAPRWSEVELTDQSLRRHGAAAVLAYRARAWRTGDDRPYEAACASTYVEDEDGSWLMLSHSQQRGASAAGDA